jgi:hypothetical protein
VQATRTRGDNKMKALNELSNTDQLGEMERMADLGHVLSLALGGVLLLLGQVARLRAEGWTSRGGALGGLSGYLQSIAVL